MASKVRYKSAKALGAVVLLASLVVVGLGVAGLLGWFAPATPPKVKSFSVAPKLALSVTSKTPSKLLAHSVRPFTPLSVSIPSIGITSVKVTPEGDPNGVLGVPPIQDGWGWWFGGGLPGAGHGAILLDGHVDWAGYGNGPARQIWNVVPGTIAIVHGPSGEQQSYVAVSLQSYLKTALPAIAGQIFSVSGPERLVIVTCGGSFNFQTGSWNSNVIATFVPVPSPLVAHTS